ncbi:hypothetical protein F751_5103 [Auxenochlorella protothecoides]|uniref:Uncharacterized protein n=1 Tax=Auxenochlorella protothecoides TaxID=3075 RepID=A0A087SEV7_AUXPR|nr:hypothetical protein F751_5103 [Auxenochlorella protothecoides]KFM24261.1 hypothetical protein F751_5103 [Auxenochlorella protothecoides]
MVRLITRAVGGVGNILAMAPWTETSKWFTQEAKPGRGIFSGRHPSLLWKLLCRGADGGQELWQAGAHWRLPPHGRMDIPGTLMDQAPTPSNIAITLM